MIPRLGGTSYYGVMISHSVHVYLVSCCCHPTDTVDLPQIEKLPLGHDRCRQVTNQVALWKADIVEREQTIQVGNFLVSVEFSYDYNSTTFCMFLLSRPYPEVGYLNFGVTTRNHTALLCGTIRLFSRSC